MIFPPKNNMNMDIANGKLRIQSLKSELEMIKNMNSIDWENHKMFINDLKTEIIVLPKVRNGKAIQ